MPNDFCPTCLVDFDAMTADQRAAHVAVAEYVVRTCEGRWDAACIVECCREALENAGSDLEHTDALRLDFMRAAASALCEAADAQAIDVDEIVPLVEDLVSILDDETITSDDPAADAAIVRRLHASIGVST